jgi:putative Mn2+ efflux pump MntP
VLSLALAADAFSVGAGVGLSHQESRQIFRISFHFGLFQGLFALAGILAGSLFLPWMEAWDHWLAFALLVLVGIRMIRGGLSGEGEGFTDRDQTRGWSLILLSTAVSIDALAAGVGLAALHAPILTTIVLIALVSALATLLAFRISGQLRRLIGSRVELIGGLTLIILASKILFEHLSA